MRDGHTPATDELIAPVLRGPTRGDPASRPAPGRGTEQSLSQASSGAALVGDGDAGVVRVKPFYDRAGIQIFLGDCRDILPRLAGIDAVISDPPYGIKYRGGGGGNLIHSRRHRRSERVAGDAEPFDPSAFCAFPHVALFGAQHYYAALPSGGTFHIWDKRGSYHPVHTADFDSIWVNRKEVGRIIRCVWRGLCREVEHNDRILHPTQKPLKVVKWVIDMFPDARCILDPLMGSGTTLRAAKDIGRRAIGIEIEERYCEIAARRLEQEVMQLEASG